MAMVEEKFPKKLRMTQKLDRLSMAVHEMSDEYEESEEESSYFGSEVVNQNPSYKTQDTTFDLMKQIEQVKEKESNERQTRLTMPSEEIKQNRITLSKDWMKI